MKAELIVAAMEAIANQETICFDVAAEYGQMFANVSHMTWFIEAVADEIGGVA